MKKLLAILLMLCSPAMAQNYLRDDGTFHSVVEGTTTGQCLTNSGGLLAGGSCGTPASPSGSVQFNNSGAFGGNAGLTYSAGNALSINPTALSNNQGLVVTQSTPNGGSVAGPINLNSMTCAIGTQTVTGTVDSSGQIANRDDCFQVNVNVTGGAANHFGINSWMNVIASNGGTVAVGAIDFINPGTTITGPHWGIDAGILVGANSTLNDQAVGVLSEVGGASTAAIKTRLAFSAVSFGTMPAGTSFDVAYAISTYAAGNVPYNGAVPFTNGVYFSTSLNSSSQFPVATTGNMFLADTGTVANIFNFLNVTASTSILTAQNIGISGTGGMVLGAGSTAAPSTGIRVTSVSAGALCVSPNSVACTNPGLEVDTSVASAITGLYIQGQASGGGLFLFTNASSTDEELRIHSRGTGGMTLTKNPSGGTFNLNVGIAGTTPAQITLASPTANSMVLVNAASATGTATIPSGTYNIVGDSTTQTLTNKSIVATQLTGTVPAAQMPAFTGDITTSAGTVATTLASSISGAKTFSTSISSPIHASSGAFTFQSNGSTFAGDITTGQQWFISGTLNTPPTGPQLTISKNAAALPALGTPTGVAGTSQAVLTVGGVDGASADINIQSFGGAFNPSVRYFQSGGTAASQIATVINATIGGTGFYGTKTAGGTAYIFGGGMFGTATENWDATHTGFRYDFYATPTGTTGVAIAASIGAGAMVGTTTDPGAGSLALNAQMFMPSITTSSAAQTGTICWTTGTGKFTVDTTVGCLTSIMAAKNITERLTSANALDIVDRLSPFAFHYKKGWGDSGHYEQFGLGAEEVALVDERLVGRDPEGKLQGVRYQELTAVLVGAIKELKAEVSELKRGRW